MLLQADCVMSHIKDRVLMVVIFLVATAALKGEIKQNQRAEERKPH